jgi:hypothetical protein
MYLMMREKTALFTASPFAENAKGSPNQSKEFCMSKKLMAALLAALVLGATAYAQTEADFNVTLTKDGEGVIITKYTGKVAAVRIPAKIQGMPVREIGEGAFSPDALIVSVVIPVGVTKIGKAAFNWNYRLTSVTIPESVLEIAESAFQACNVLTTVALPKSLTILGASAFKNTSITTIALPASLVTFTYTNDDNDDHASFAECYKLKTVTLPAGMTKIPARMFEGCSALTTINLPDSIKAIEQVAFRGCRSLTTIKLPDSIKEIGDNAFNGCTALTAINLPASIEKILPGAFDGCSALTTVTIPDSVEKITFYITYEWSEDYPFRGCGKLSLASQAALKKRGYDGKF